MLRRTAKALLAAVLLGFGGALAAIAYTGAPLMATPGPLARTGTYLTENRVSTERFSGYPEREPKSIAETPSAVYNAALSVVRSQGWRILRVDEEQRTIHAVAATPLLGFEDDVEIEVRADDPEGSVLHITSASRAGSADFGANTARLILLRRLIPERL